MATAEFYSLSDQEFRRLRETCQYGVLQRHLTAELEQTVDPFRLRIMAQYFFKIGRVSEAIAVLERLDTPEATDHFQKAIYLEHLGDFESAIRECRTALERAPDQLEVRIVLGRLTRVTGMVGEALDWLQPIVKRRLGSPRLIVRALYELSLCYDQRNDFELAFQSARTAKSLQHRNPRHVELAVQGKRWVDQMAALQRVMFDRLADCRTKSETQERLVHLIGFPRSGTTLVESRLATQSSVVAVSESQAFERLCLPQIVTSAKAGTPTCETESYFQALREISACQAEHPSWMDKRPVHVYMPLLLNAAFPDAGYCFVKRDPRDIFFSAFKRYFPLTDMSCNFDSVSNFSYLYGNAVAIWNQAFPVLQNRVYVADYEQVCQQPEQTIDQLLIDLDLARHKADCQPRYSHSPTHAEIRKAVTADSCGIWRYYYPFLSAEEQDQLDGLVENDFTLTTALRSCE